MLIRGEDGAVLPQGQVGELCITGPGVAGGYLGRPELTAEKFLANPRPRGEHDTRMYRSGDRRASTSRARSSAWAAATTR